MAKEFILIYFISLLIVINSRMSKKPSLKNTKIKPKKVNNTFKNISDKWSGLATGIGLIAVGITIGCWITSKDNNIKEMKAEQDCMKRMEEARKTWEREKADEEERMELLQFMRTYNKLNEQKDGNK